MRHRLGYAILLLVAVLLVGVREARAARIPIPDRPDLSEVPLVPTTPEERIPLAPAPEMVEGFFEPLLTIYGYREVAPDFLTTWTFPPLTYRELYLSGLGQPKLPIQDLDIGFFGLWTLPNGSEAFSP